MGVPILQILETQKSVIWVFVATTGAIIGSFLSMMTYRLPRILKQQWEAECREHLAIEPLPPSAPFNLAWPGSHCPQCQTPLGLLDNIPLLGFLFLRGKCRHCHKPIPRRYFAIEVLTTLAALIVVAHFGLNGRAFFAFILSAGLIGLSFIDAAERLLPDTITYPLLWLGLLANTAGTFTSLPMAVWGAAVGYLFLWFIFHIFRLITGKEGMGYGDFKLFAVGGAWLGWPLLPLILLLASLSGAIIGVTLIARGKQQRGSPIAFGPFLCGAIWIGLLFGMPLMTAYLQALHGI